MLESKDIVSTSTRLCVYLMAQFGAKRPRKGDRKLIKASIFSIDFLRIKKLKNAELAKVH